jgi:hypothetical protein
MALSSVSVATNSLLLRRQGRVAEGVAQAARPAETAGKQVGEASA